MTPQHETPEFLSTKAFIALCDCVGRLSRRPSLELPPSMAAARLATISSAVVAADDTPISSEALHAVLRTPSIEIARAIFDGPKADQWREVLANYVWRIEKERAGLRYALDVVHALTIEHIVYLEELGVPLRDVRMEMGRRMLIDPDPRIDVVMARLIVEEHGETDPILHAAFWNSSALKMMQPRHFRRLETILASDRSEEARSALAYLAERIVIPRDWREAALLLRIGYLPEDCLDGAPKAVLDLAQKTGSAHGRLRLIELEPDIEGMTARDPDAAFFGLTRKQVKAARSKEVAT